MDRFFYIDSEGKQKGTFTLEELRNEHIGKQTMVWTQGMAEWKRAYEVPELQHLFEVVIANDYQMAPPQTQYQQAYQTANTQIGVTPMPKSWMVESILVTILPFLLCGNVFCLLGIIAIVSASKVESLYHQGLYAQANEASLNAGRWTKITLWIAIGAIILAIVGFIISIVFLGSLAGIGNALSI